MRSSERSSPRRASWASAGAGSPRSSSCRTTRCSRACPAGRRPMWTRCCRCRGGLGCPARDLRAWGVRTGVLFEAARVAEVGGRWRDFKAGSIRSILAACRVSGEVRSRESPRRREHLGRRRWDSRLSPANLVGAARPGAVTLGQHRASVPRVGVVLALVDPNLACLRACSS